MRPNREKVFQIWEEFLQRERSWKRRLLGAISIAAIGLALTDGSYRLSGHYSSGLPVATAAIIALYSGYGLSLIAGVALALAADYLYIPPTGSVLDSAAGYVHLFGIIILTVLMCLLVASLRAALSRMRQARRSAEQSRARMEQVLSVVSHDLRNPIAVARAGAETLANFKTDPERARKIECGIIEAMDRADSMIRDLLNANQTQLGGDPKQGLDLSQLADQLIKDFSLVHGDRFELQAQAGVQGPWSRQDLRRAIENLLGNAVKYGAPNEKITLRIEQDSQEARISVHNVGEPIPAERQAHLIHHSHPSKRVKDSRKEGWGIGLMSASQIVEAYEGRITVESSKERGTLFTIHLPKR